MIFTKATSLSWSCVFGMLIRFVSNLYHCNCCQQSPNTWWSNGLHFGYQGCIKTHKQPIWWMVVNEGVVLIKKTRFHNVEIIECFIKLVCQDESLDGFIHQVRSRRYCDLMDISHVDWSCRSTLYYCWNNEGYEFSHIKSVLSNKIFIWSDLWSSDGRFHRCMVQ